MEGIQVRLSDGTAVTVPASLDCLSTYVLLEQEDWFEKELPFVRTLLRPGMRALDVGANYGVYSVGMGNVVGSSGHVWAVEPSDRTCRFLRHTLMYNKMAHVTVQQCALSDRAGRGRLSMRSNSELNSLVEGDESSEEVEIDTLDRLAGRLGIQGIDFVKLDAEGEEMAIVAGGREFFHAEDPLVMFEVKHGQKVNLELATAFRSYGYQIYRLIGPPDLLVSVDPGFVLDGFELNLFACKDSRAAHLERRGLLLRAPSLSEGAELGVGTKLFQSQVFASGWPITKAATTSALSESLDTYAHWRQVEANTAGRFGALQSTFSHLDATAARLPRVEVFSLLARAALELGRRGTAILALEALLKVASRPGVAVADPTWPAARRYDSIPISGDLLTWLGAAAAEALITSSEFSGFFSGPKMLTYLDWMRATPYASAPMERRRQLQQLQAGLIATIQPSPLLSVPAPEHLNSEFWRCAAREQTRMPAGRVVTIA
jgi:FkbM family methyltransferase